MAEINDRRVSKSEGVVLKINEAMVVLIGLFDFRNQVGCGAVANQAADGRSGAVVAVERTATGKKYRFGRLVQATIDQVTVGDGESVQIPNGFSGLNQGNFLMEVEFVEGLQ